MNRGRADSPLLMPDKSGCQRRHSIAVPDRQGGAAERGKSAYGNASAKEGWSGKEKAV